MKKKRRLGQWTDYSKYIPDGWYIPEGAGQETWPTCPVTGKPAMVHTMPWGLNVAICPKPAAPEIVYLVPPGSGGGPYPLTVTFKYPYQEWPPLSLLRPTIPGLVPASSFQTPVYQYPAAVEAVTPSETDAADSGIKIPDIKDIPIWIWLVGGLGLIFLIKK